MPWGRIPTGRFIQGYLISHTEGYVWEVWEAFVKELAPYNFKCPSYTSFCKYFYQLRKLGLIYLNKTEPASVPTAIPRHYFKVYVEKVNSDSWKNPHKTLYPIHYSLTKATRPKRKRKQGRPKKQKVPFHMPKGLGAESKEGKVIVPHPKPYKEPVKTFVYYSDIGYWTTPNETAEVLEILNSLGVNPPPIPKIEGSYSAGGVAFGPAVRELAIHARAGGQTIVVSKVTLDEMIQHIQVKSATPR